MIIDTLKSVIGYVAKPYLDRQTRPSLEVIAAEGERESFEKDEETYFVYQLLTPLGRRYDVSFDLQSLLTGPARHLPQLPSSTCNIEDTAKSGFRDFVDPREAGKDYPKIGTELDEALEEFDIYQEARGMWGIFGTFVPDLRTLVYVRAENPGDADTKVSAYVEKVNGILQANRLRRRNKIKPILKSKALPIKPGYVSHHIFAGGC